MGRHGYKDWLVPAAIGAMGRVGSMMGSVSLGGKEFGVKGKQKDRPSDVEEESMSLISQGSNDKAVREGTSDSDVDKHRIMTIVLLYIGFMGLMMNRGAMDSANSAMASDPDLQWDYEIAGGVFAWGNVSYFIGKVMSGFCVDMMGGKLVFAAALLVVGTNNIALAGSSGPISISVLWCVLRIFLSFGWPAVLKIVCAWCHPRTYGRVFGVLSTASRSGAVLGSVFLGEMLMHDVPWRMLFLFCGGSLLIVFLASCFLLQESPPRDGASLRSIELTSRRRRSDDMGMDGFGIDEKLCGGEEKSIDQGDLSFTEAVRFFFSDSQFWLMCLTILCLTPMTEMSSWWPSFLASTLEVSPGVGASLASAFPAGFIISVLIGGHIYDWFSEWGRFYFVSGLCSCLALLVVSLRVSISYIPAANLAVWVIAHLFLMGFTIGPPFYIPVSVYASAFGGKRHCSTLSGILDGMGYLSTTLFMKIVGKWAKAHAWIQVLDILILLSMFSGFTFAFFMLRNTRLKYC